MISAIIPWRAGCPDRERSLTWVIQYLENLVDEVVIGEITGEWCKAKAVAEGLRETSGDVLVIHDADVFIEAEWLGECLGALYSHDWASPHVWVNRLQSSDANDRVMAGSNPWAEPRQRHQAFLGGGIVVLPRIVYEDCPLDPRYEGWGQEDESWAKALTALYGEPFRGQHDLWHLWHPPQKRLNRRWGSAPSMELFDRYNTANTLQIRTLIEEAKHDLNTFAESDR